jgi:hypothetical protein
MSPKLSKTQEDVLRLVHRTHEKGGWYRAQRNGQRVTLASLYRKGLLQRRVWRESANSADNAHEYRCSDMFMEEWRRKCQASRATI